MTALKIALAADLTGGGALIFALFVLLMLAVPVTVLFGIAIVARRLWRRF